MDRRQFFGTIGAGMVVAACAPDLVAAPAASTSPGPLPKPAGRLKLKLGCQSGPSTDEHFAYLARYGVTNICARAPVSDGRLYSTVAELTDLKGLAERHGLSFDILDPVMLPSSHIDRERNPAIMLGEGPAARSIKLDLPRFTLVGATTRAGMLTSPLRDRFGIVHRLEFYTPGELASIVARSARILDIACDEDGAAEIARRSRGTPRIANRLLRRVRDYAEVRAHGCITRDAASAALEMLQVDAGGYDELDRRLLRLILEQFDGGPVGVESLAAALAEDRDTIEDVLEPYLIQQGLLARTARGRIATSRAWRHFGLKPPRGSEPALNLFEDERS